MSWETDQTVIGYLERRIKYYKKKRGYVKNIIKDKFFLERYGKVSLRKSIKERVAHIELRIEEYTLAISIIKKSIKMKKYDKQSTRLGN